MYQLRTVQFVDPGVKVEKSASAKPEGGGRDGLA